MMDALHVNYRDHSGFYTTETTAGDCVAAWQSYETASVDGIRVRVAVSMQDAEGIRAVLRSGWRVSETEPYFYEVFNHAEAVFRELVAPATRTDEVRCLDALCLVVEETGGRIVGTMSLIFDHERRQVELVRGAVAHDVRGNQIMRHFMAPVRRLLARVPEYAVIVDATFLTRSAGVFVEHLGAPAVAIHPSSSVIQKSCVADWLEDLTCRHGHGVARALLYRSRVTGLGRFATAYHLAMPAGQAVHAPCLVDTQRPFYEHTRQVLSLSPDAGVQRPMVRREQVKDQQHTAVRMVIDPPADMDPRAYARAAAGAGFDTLVIHVPCDRRYLDTSGRMQHAGGILSGVFPDTFGRWHASYTFLVGRGHREQVLHGLGVLARRHDMRTGSYAALLRQIVSLHELHRMVVA